MSDALVRTLLTLAAVLCVAVGVHFASILMLPRLAPLDAYARVAAGAREGTVTVLPPAAAASNPLPRRDPLVATAICRFDLRAGSMRVVAPLSGAAFEALSFYSRWGTAFYGLTDRAGNEGALNVTLVTQAQFDQAKAGDDDAEKAPAVRVVAPTIEGFVKLDVLAPVGGYSAAERIVRSMRCEIERTR